MIILGIGSPFIHDPSAAILVDGKLAAAADEETPGAPSQALC